MIGVFCLLVGDYGLYFGLFLCPGTAITLSEGFLNNTLVFALHTLQIIFLFNFIFQEMALPPKDYGIHPISYRIPDGVA